MPGKRVYFRGLHMTKPLILLSGIFFEYETASETLFQNLSLQFLPGWTGIVGANGSGKSSLLKLISGQNIPDAGTLQISGRLLHCEQEICSPPANISSFFSSFDPYGFRLRNNLKVSAEMATRWENLSMGERKKIQIAAALFEKPDILCIDEPTNHLDAEGQELLLNELAVFKGIGLLVSHDRKLLNTLCTHCLFLESGTAKLLSGNLESGQGQIMAEFESRQNLQANLKSQLRKNREELRRCREKEAEAAKNNSKRKLGLHDHDAKTRIDAARLGRHSRASGDAAGMQQNKVHELNAELDSIGKLKIPVFKFKIPAAVYSEKNLLLDFPPSEIPLGPEKILRVPALKIGPKDRIAVTGSNGSGKSSLIKNLINNLKLSEDQYIYMPQELDEPMRAELHSHIQSLSKTDFSAVMNVCASLGSSPTRIMESASCSPGEWRKLLFGLGTLRPLNLIIMDEPTNHLDLPSLECLERALKSCPSALLLVSHDKIFLEQLCSTIWNIDADSETINTLKQLNWNCKTGKHPTL